MQVRYEASFEKDLKSISDKNLLKKIKKVIEEVKQADDSFSINNLKKLRGYDTFYRIRIGEDNSRNIHARDIGNSKVISGDDKKIK